MSSMIDGRRLAYWRSAGPDPGKGDGRSPAARTVLLLHGLGADHEGLLTLTRTWPDTHIVAPDLPGFGRSEPLSGRHSLANYAHVMRRLLAQLDLAELTVVGHSLGASIALALAAAHPRRIGELVLISPVVGGAGPGAWLVRGYYGLGALLPARAARMWFLSRAAVYLSDRSMFATEDPRVRRRILEADYRSAALADPRAIVEIYRSVLQTPLLALAGGVRVPTVVVGGERDNLAAPAALAALYHRLPRGALRVIPKAGHLWSVERPEHATRVILGALDGLARRPAA